MGGGGFGRAKCCRPRRGEGEDSCPDFSPHARTDVRGPRVSGRARGRSRTFLWPQSDKLAGVRLLRRRTAPCARPAASRQAVARGARRQARGGLVQLRVHSTARDRPTANERVSRAAGPRLAAQQCHTSGNNSTEIRIPVGFVGMFKMDSSLRENASKRLLKSLKMIMPTTLAGRFLPVCGGHFLRTGPAGSAGGHPTFRAPHPQPCSLRPGSLS